MDILGEARHKMLRYGGFTEAAATAILTSGVQQGDQLFNLLRSMNQQGKSPDLANNRAYDALGKNFCDMINRHPDLARNIEVELEGKPDLKNKISQVAKKNPESLDAAMKFYEEKILSTPDVRERAQKVRLDQIIDKATAEPRFFPDLMKAPAPSPAVKPQEKTVSPPPASPPPVSPSPVKPVESAPTAAPPPSPPPLPEPAGAASGNEEQKGAVLRNYFKMAAENPHMRDNLARNPGTEKKFFELAAEDPAVAQSVLDDVQNKRGMFSKLVDHKEWEKIAPDFQEMLAGGLKERLKVKEGDPAAADIDGFARRAAANEDMGRAIFTAATQGQDGKMMQALEGAFHKDKDLFKKANQFIDDHPQQMSMVTDQFLNDPKKAFKTMETIETGSQIKSAGQDFFNRMGWNGAGRMFGGMMDWMMSSPLGMILLSFIGPLLARFMGSKEEMDETVKAGTEANPTSVATNNDAKLIEAVTKNGGTVKDQNGRTYTINAPKDRNPDQNGSEPDPQTVTGPRVIPNPPGVV